MILCYVKVVDGVLMFDLNCYDKFEVWEGLGDDVKVIFLFDFLEVEIGVVLWVVLDWCIF